MLELTVVKALGTSVAIRKTRKGLCLYERSFLGHRPNQGRSLTFGCRLFGRAKPLPQALRQSRIGGH
jgi:hypothetical protein